MKIVFKAVGFCILIIISLYVLIVFLMFRPRPGDGAYGGEYPELYSVAINSILGAKGYLVSERPFDSIIEVVEEDKYGRKIFLYYEGKAVSCNSIIICQKSDSNYTYFYPDYNFISVGYQDENNSIMTTIKFFSDEQIEELKKQNDWDLELDESKMINAKIVRRKPNGTVSKSNFDNAYKQILGYGKHNGYSVCFITDDFNRSMYYVSAGEVKNRRNIVLFFQPNGKFDKDKGVMELTDLNNYQDELKAFKEANSWNMPVGAKGSAI